MGKPGPQPIICKGERQSAICVVGAAGIGGGRRLERQSRGLPETVPCTGRAHKGAEVREFPEMERKEASSSLKRGQ